MATIESEPRLTKESSQPESEEWNYYVERVTGDYEQDEVLNSRADRVEKILEEPLPEKLVIDTDNYVGLKLQEEDRPKLFRDILGQEAVEILRIEADESYAELVRSLSGHEGREAKSLDEVWGELRLLKGAERVKRLQAIKVFSLALNEVLPVHSSQEEWDRLDEADKGVVRAAEITKLRADVEVCAVVVERSKQFTDEVKAEQAREMAEVLRDYAQGADVPLVVREEFVNEADWMNRWEEKIEMEAERKIKVRQERGLTGEDKDKRAELPIKPDEAESLNGERINANEETVILRGNETETVIAVGQQVAEQTNTALSPPDVQPEAVEKKPVSEYIDRPIFGKEAIKSKDIKAIQERLKEQAEKNNPRSAFEVARQLAHLKRAGIKLSDQGREHYWRSLEKQGAAMRERGAKAVAQYHVYLKYLGMEDGLADEDREIIRDGCEMGGLGNRRQLAALAMNAKYLGVLEDVNVIKDDLQADFRGQLEDAVDIDTIALEMARRKYLAVQQELPDKYADQQKLINSRLAGYGKDERWDEYVRLKTQVDYVRGSETMDEKKQEKLLGHVEKMAEQARANGTWSEYSAYIADAARLSCHGKGREKQNGDKRERGEEESVVPGLGTALEEESPQNKFAGKDANEERNERAGTKDVEVTGEEEISAQAAVPTGEGEQKVDPEQYPHRAKFDNRTRLFNEAQEKGLAAWGNDKDILQRDKSELMSRETVLMRRRHELAAGENNEDDEARWANEVMGMLRDGADFSEVVNEEYLMQQLEKHQADEIGRENRRQRYLGILRNELGVAQMMDEPTVMDKMSSLWMEKWYARWRVAKGLGKVKAAWPWGKAKRREVVNVRQDTVNSMLEAANDNEVDGKVRALLRRLATELEIMNVREAKGVLVYKPLTKKEKGKKETRQTAQADGNEQKLAGEEKPGEAKEE